MQCCKGRFLMRIPMPVSCLFQQQANEPVRSIVAEYDIPADRIITCFARRHELPAILSLQPVVFPLFYQALLFKNLFFPNQTGRDHGTPGFPSITMPGRRCVYGCGKVRTFNAGFILPDFSLPVAWKAVTSTQYFKTALDSTRSARGFHLFRPRKGCGEICRRLSPDIILSNN